MTHRALAPLASLHGLVEHPQFWTRLVKLHQARAQAQPQQHSYGSWSRCERSAPHMLFCRSDPNRKSLKWGHHTPHMADPISRAWHCLSLWSLEATVATVGSEQLGLPVKTSRHTSAHRIGRSRRPVASPPRSFRRGCRQRKQPQQRVGAGQSSQAGARLSVTFARVLASHAVAAGYGAKSAAIPEHSALRKTRA